MRMLESIQSFDTRWLLLLQQSESALALNSRAVSRTADGQLYVFIVLLITTVTGTDHPFLAHVLIAFALERPLYWLMKNGLKRKRPAEALGDFQSHIIASDRFSFPSGHTSAAFLFVTLMALHFGPLLTLLYPWAMAVALSRIYLGVHFPTDTVMGAILGSGIAIATATVFV